MERRRPRSDARGQGIFLGSHDLCGRVGRRGVFFGSCDTRSDARKRGAFMESRVLHTKVRSFQNVRQFIAGSPHHLVSSPTLGEVRARGARVREEVAWENECEILAWLFAVGGRGNNEGWERRRGGFCGDSRLSAHQGCVLGRSAWAWREPETARL